MLNVSKAVYADNLPVPLVKQVSIIDWPTNQAPSQTEDSPDQIYKFVVDIMVQTTRRDYFDPTNLSVVMLTENEEMQMASVDAIRKNYIFQETDRVKNIKIVDLMEGVGQYSFSDQESSLLYSKTISVPFEVESSELLRNVSILAFTTPASKEYQTKSPAPARFRNESLKMSRYILEDIMVGGSLVRKTNVHTLAEDLPSYGSMGDVWTGPTHRHPGNGLMAEQAHLEIPHPKLNTTVVMNQKIKDYRIENISIFPPPGKKDDTRSFLSSLYFSRNADNSLRLFFSLDLLRYMKQNSAVANLVDNDTALLSMSKIENIKLYRQRATMNDLGNRLTPDKANDQLCQRLEKKLVATLSEEGIRSIEASLNQQPGIREFMAIDSEIAFESKNYYNYELEFEIVDEGPSTLTMLAQKLEDLLAQFRSTYKQKFLNTGKRGYDVLAYLVANQDSLNGNKTWEALLHQYLATLTFMGLPSQKGISVPDMAIALYSLASPYSADNSSLLKFEQIISLFVDRLYYGLLPSPITRSESKLNVRSKIEGTRAAARRLKYVPPIKQAYYNENDADTGLDYLGNYTLSQKNNFVRVSYDAYNRRTEDEAKKYNISNADSEDINPYGFLSPAIVKAGTKNIQTVLGIGADAFLDLIRSDVVDSTPVKNYVGNPDLERNRVAETQGILGASGVSIAPTVLSLAKIQQQGPNATAPIKDASLYLGRTGSCSSYFVNDDRSTEEALSGSRDPKITAQRSMPRALNNSFSKTIVDRKVSNFKTPQPTDLETIRGSYGFGNIKGSAGAFAARPVVDKNINFNSLVRVEYLSSYENGVANPQWETLTPGIYSQAVTEGTPLLCRLYGPLKCLSLESPFNLEKYDSLFILGDRNLVADTETRVLTVENYMGQTEQKVSKLFTQGVLNNKTPNGPALSQYTMTNGTSQMTLTYASPRRSMRATSAPASSTAGSSTNQGGGY
jgi:hypothetical protein